ncbi:hypothetical protein Q4574_16385 [Aliiglaciecola sp. 3_MG-2023]|uniref:hypothetical protein n=1 Tax=Aliiglaciecola sp. 3_MG-2023 TaxID=3062644 RepID=UPI0026E212CD|nr:hypothetical protein [Aliiglaciecola sp. 3_MG-2023]MDO6694877.1 hypothetical protein [Aliiglaciecola sp. 3_MG-2023]
MPYSKYKSKAANEKHANLMISLSEKIVWGVLAVPITYLAKSDAGQYLQGDRIGPYIVIGLVLFLTAIHFQKTGFSILDEVNAKETESGEKNV